MAIIEDILKEKGYSPWEQKQQGIFYRVTQEVTYVVALMRGEDKFIKPLEEYNQFHDRLEEEFTAFANNKVQVLFIFGIDSQVTPSLQNIIDKVPGVWLITEADLQLRVYENQPTMFDGLYEHIEDALENVRIQQKKENGFPVTAPITIGLIAINVLIFLYLSIKGDVYDAQFMFDHGATAFTAIVFDHEYYRLLTSMFLHFGVAHLVNNMVVLGIAGDQLEKLLGKARYCVLYFGSGLVGSIISTIMHMMANENVVSAGASGAINGIIGGFVFAAIKNRIDNKDNRRQVSPARAVLIIAGMIYLTVGGSGVDNWAHIGGFVSGFLICLLFSLWNYLQGKKK